MVRKKKNLTSDINLSDRLWTIELCLKLCKTVIFFSFGFKKYGAILNNHSCVERSKGCKNHYSIPNTARAIALIK